MTTSFVQLTPTQLILISLTVVAVAYLTSRKRLNYLLRPKRPEFSLHPLCPSFISGAYAAYRLGTDEAGFLKELHRDYGPIVWMPAPLNHHAVLSDDLVKHIYDGSYNKKLSFTPIRKAMAGRIFDLSTWAEDHHAEQVWPLHARRLLPKARLQTPMNRYSLELDRCIAEEKAKLASGVKTARSVDLVEWSYQIMCRTSVHALMGCEIQNDVQMSDLIQHFRNFDTAFPLLASGLVPPAIQNYLLIFTGKGDVSKGITSRNWLNRTLGKWAAQSCPGLEEGDTIKDIRDLCIDKLGYDSYQAGVMVLGDYWALLANTPNAVCWFMAIFVQCEDDFRVALLNEIDEVYAAQPRDLGAAIITAEMPILTSALWEVLRRFGSSTSLRQNITGESCPVYDTEEASKVISWILPDEECACYTRFSSIDASLWKKPETFDPYRFFGEKRSRVTDLRVFGGGSSMCEGRNLAMAELKVMITQCLHDFEFKPAEDLLEKCTDRLVLSSGKAIAIPMFKPGRPGLGILQLGEAMPVEINIRKA